MLPRKSEITHLRLLEVASETISKVGLERTTARLLAKQAGVSLGCVTRYFPEFSELFPDVVRYIFNQIIPDVRQRPEFETAEETFYRIARQNFDYFTIQKPHYNRCLMLSFFYIGINQSVRKAHLTVIEDSIKSMDKILEKLAVENKIKIAEADRRLLARSFLEQLIAAVDSCMFTKNDKKRKQIADDFLKLTKQRIQHMIWYAKTGPA